jgi:hypothetical protein
MIKFFGLIPRLPSITSKEFHDHYRHPHGTFGREFTMFRGYVQSHQIHTDLLGAGQSVYEAVAEVWFDNAHDGTSLGDDPHYLQFLKPDETAFVDLENLKWLYTTEEVVVSGPDRRTEQDPATVRLQGFHLTRPNTIKLMQYVKPEAGDGWASTHDAELGARIGAIRHVRCHPATEIHDPESPASFAGVRELWWPTVTAFEEGVAAGGTALADLLGPATGSVTLLAHAERFI